MKLPMTARHAVFSRWGMLLNLCVCGASCAVAAGQMRPTALEGATVLTGSGRTLEHVTMIVQGGRVSALGSGVQAPFMAQRVSVAGKFITPGLIDAWSTLGMRLGGGAEATGRAADAFDRYDQDEILAALAQGVTAVYVPARAADSIGGLGAIIKLKPGATLEEMIVKDEAALCASLGVSPGSGPLARVRLAAEFRKRWQEAKAYREAREIYEEELEVYEKKIKERAAKEKTEAKDDKKDEAKGDEKKGRPGGQAVDSDDPDLGSADFEASPADDGDDTQPRPRPRGGRRGREQPSEQKPAGDGDGKDKKDEIKKPVEPPVDRAKELLLRVIDGKLSLRVEVHKPEDILNVLDIAREFNLGLILEGATGAYLVADKLAEADVPVVLGAPSSTMRFDPGPLRYETPDDAALLTKAGVKVLLGSGEDGATRHLALNAARRAAHGLNPEAALQAITSDAARMLGVEKELGRIDRGMPADFVIWSDHPFSPGARVEAVFIDGVQVYPADSN
jgi:imidazolonepropionase-like amidohydrolase